MNPNFAEALTKAAQAAQMFRDDLADVYKHTETVADKMIFSDLLRQVNEIHGKLALFNEEAQKVVNPPTFSDQYLALIEKVRVIDEAAAEYMIKDAPKLSSFNCHAIALGACFMWRETKQGYSYWAEIAKKLNEEKYTQIKKDKS